MKILILGAGQIGSNLAEHLVQEGHDITVVDTACDLLDELNVSLDIRTVAGKASHPSVLRAAGCEDADLLIAVTNSDEINMLACEVANALFQTPTKIARVRDKDYLGQKALFSPKAVPVDVIISPEQLVTDNIFSLFEYPGSLQVLDFADGRVQLVAVRAVEGGPLIGQKLATIGRHLPNVETRVAAIYRQGEAIIPHGSTIVEKDDEVFFLASRQDTPTVMHELGKAERGYRRITIAGGGNIGERLAEKLEDRHQVKLIEADEARCRYLAERLKHTVVLHGRSTRKRLLVEESIEDCDIFCALTNSDEDNIMSSLLAKRLGAHKVLTLITDPAYVDLLQGGDIDVAVSPQQVTIGSILAYIRRGDMVKAYSLRRGAAEAIEAVAHGDAKTSRLVGCRLDAIKLPEGVTIGAVIRGDDIMMEHRDICIETDDHLILFLTDKRRLHDVERLFQVGLSYF
ncbi:Trk system potassium transporter TrkA [Halomonas sp. McH1-25]|uniref:Trk system potassium transporter TrkA n=1 Tax=unclassified Halomonas TaxID=2609666 RepID=UPI001EF70ED7|nr:MULTISPECIES: Trk system potassium transporter TrkA [unclassified Halomonas]MCG7599858.1 Trk system potassium transporter TrkA [Halomonas sp. McH1-25]MCP1343052.1 Trk system potassium transporter TrkA [Halomonas sp. FL8]MCP1361580.1 Trk system potassium transporter TrkA [Halomonas sp. BBD45]MCP1365342.1 Trk system potassium transporter TrkA [Halomonas sp. BBD48]